MWDEVPGYKQVFLWKRAEAHLVADASLVVFFCTMLSCNYHLVCEFSQREKPHPQANIIYIVLIEIQLH